MYIHGWYQVAFENDLSEGLTAGAVGTKRLVLVRTPEGIRAFDGDCPHRGAHLAYGGKLDGSCIVCPFHGYRIGLGTDSQQGFGIREYHTLVIGGMVFVQLSDMHENGFTTLIRSLAEYHTFVPGFSVSINVRADLVTENGFDNRHFNSVHGILKNPKFVVRQGEHGELVVESMFEIPLVTQNNEKTKQKVPYIARAFSPGLIVVQLEGESGYTIITGTTPTMDGKSVIRLSLALPIKLYGPIPNEEFCRRLLDYSKKGIEDDRVMWENMSTTYPHKYTPEDSAVREFHRFCELFEGQGYEP